jgi:two-component system LytT family sensor kinase
LITGFVASGEQGSIGAIIFSRAFILFALVYPIFFYLNTYLLLPAFYFRRQYVFYAVGIVLFFIVVFLVSPFDQLMHATNFQRRPPGTDNFSPRPGPGPRGPHFDIVSIILFIMVWSCGAALQFIRQWKSTEERVARAEADRANAELSFLKAQINPHFLFNTLNNIYSMAVAKNEMTAPAIMKLSNIMRYITDEVSENMVPLENEIECAANYVDLQKMRLSEKTKLEFSVSGNSEGRTIVPLIFMTFIENVFKYGTSSHEPSVALIKIIVEKDLVILHCRNKIFAGKKAEERTGIGISNTRLRLEHLYPGKYKLEIFTDGYYDVKLQLQFH